MSHRNWSGNSKQQMFHKIFGFFGHNFLFVQLSRLFHSCQQAEENKVNTWAVPVAREDEVQGVILGYHGNSLLSTQNEFEFICAVCNLQDVKTLCMSATLGLSPAVASFVHWSDVHVCVCVCLCDCMPSNSCLQIHLNREDIVCGDASMPENVQLSDRGPVANKICCSRATGWREERVRRVQRCWTAHSESSREGHRCSLTGTNLTQCGWENIVLNQFVRCRIPFALQEFTSTF